MMKFKLKRLQAISLAIPVLAIGIFACQKVTESDLSQGRELALKAGFDAYTYKEVTLTSDEFVQISSLFTTEEVGSFPRPTNAKKGDKIAIAGVTDAGAVLGRVLFYDPRLSLNNLISCASCHAQSKGFADGMQFSEGFQGAMTTRNAMHIVNPALATAGMFWDERERSVRDLTLKPVQNHIEMGMENLTTLETKLSRIKEYPALFQKAFGTSTVSAKNVSDALTQFLRSMVSCDSKYDRTVAKTETLTGLEKRGSAIFFDHDKGRCVSCHRAPTFGSQYYGGGANIGLDASYTDQGKGSGHFKVPSLRNVELTAPYMHDGRFKTLEEVVEHYNSGIKNHPSLNWELRGDNGSGVRRLNLNDYDKSALVAFLRTLTDQTYVTDPKYASPFQ